jgi:hypothetical protein
MKSLALSVCLALTTAARAQLAPAESAGALPPATETPATGPAADALPGRAAFDAEIQAWRTLLPKTDPPTPLTTEFEPRLDKIAEAVKAAKDADGLVQPRKDFETLSHELVLRNFRQSQAQGLRPGTLAEFSERQRALVETNAAQRRQMMAPVMSRAATAAGDGSRMFYDNDGHNGAAIMLPGNFGSPRAAVVNARSQGVHLHTGDTPPPVTSAALSFQSLFDYVDSTRGGRIAHAVASQAVGFTHWCFAAVKEAFISAKDKLWAKISDPTESGEIGIPPAVAADYARALNKNPQLMAKLGYRRVDVTTLPGNDPSIVPEGTVFDFAPGCAGYSAGAGHIEIVAARARLTEIHSRARPNLDADQVLACSDGCHGRTMNYFRTYGSARRVGRFVRPACMNMYVPVKDALPAATLSI